MKRLMLILFGVGLMFSFLSSSALAGGFTQAEIKLVAKALMNKMEVSKELTYSLNSKLNAVLEDPMVGEAVNSKGAAAVFVCRSGEGGFIIKFKKGDGLISFKQGRKDAPISLKSWSAGAMIGGSAQWGVGIVVGLANDSDFGGDYSGSVKGATAANATTPGYLVLTHVSGKSRHEIYLIFTGRGLSADVGGEKMSIIPNW